MSRAPRLIAVNKPFDMLCQFTQGTTPPAGATAPRRTLADLRLPSQLYPAGRLDRDSEGLLLLTDDGALQHRLAHPSRHLPKRYRVQVDGRPDEATLQRLLAGVALKDGPARALHAVAIDDEEASPWPREPPVRVRRRIPTGWLELSIDEGRNRQVRRMTAAIDHPTLRLIRLAIGPFELDGLLPGQWRDLDASLLTDLPTVRGDAARGERRGARAGRAAGERFGKRDGARRSGRSGRSDRSGRPEQPRRRETSSSRRRSMRQWPRSTE